MAVAEAPTSDVAIARVEAFGGGHERGPARGAGAAGVGVAPLGGICADREPGSRSNAATIAGRLQFPPTGGCRVFLYSSW